MELSVELVSVIVGLPAGRPCVLLVKDGLDWALPSTPLEQPERSLQAGTRRWVEELTGHRLGYLEQLYTFADADREHNAGRSIAISYLGLTRTNSDTAMWVPWYDFLPWEDRRTQDASAGIVAALREWAASEDELAPTRQRRVAVTFGLDGHEWVADWALQRYELMYEAGLVREAGTVDAGAGHPMVADHRRILATAMGRLRAKIEYRPVVFELLDEQFTLAQLQRCVEAIRGQQAHTQNFRRLIEQEALVEPTGEVTQTGGRPAKLYRFRPEVIEARAFAGTKLPTTRSGRSATSRPLSQ